MYMCFNCGEVFEEGSRYLDSEWNKDLICPHCKGEIEKAVQCNMCEEDFGEDDVTNGICIYCAKNKIDYEIALRYFKDRKILREFFIVWYWQICDRAPDSENEEVDALFEVVFNQKTTYDKESGKSFFLKQLQEYILQDIYDWTEFLRKEENCK